MIKSKTQFTAYIGTYTSDESQGIYSFNLNSLSGKIRNLKLAAKLENPTYLSINKDNSLLYSVIKSGNMGGCTSFLIDKTNGNLKALNSEFGEKNPPNEYAGKQPCYVSIDKDSNYLFSANYHAGKIEVYPIKDDGSLSSISSMIFHKGCGPNKERQASAHIHCAVATPDNNYVCTIDLGMDKIISYKFSDGILKKSNEFNLKPGCGPRHITFHPNGKFAYVVTELSSEVVTLEYSKENCAFKELQYISTVPKKYCDNNGGAAIHISPDSKYLYTSTRGHNSITCFKIEDNGTLTLVSNTSTEGISPRDFEIAPSGEFIAAANQDSNNVTIFKVNKSTGKLTYTGESIKISKPVCIKFLEN